MYPANDDQFEETTINKVEKSGDGLTEPKEGMTARFYGKGIGFNVRGLFLNGNEVFYRTEEQEREHCEIESYGADATEWLKRWDGGKTVWSISMGGLGPGYEQAIQITVAEILRHLLERNYDASAWADSEKWQFDRKEIEAAGLANTKIGELGITGAQWGAAMNMALQLYRRGPRAIMADEQVKDRHIQVSRTFPQG